MPYTCEPTSIAYLRSNLLRIMLTHYPVRLDKVKQKKLHVLIECWRYETHLASNQPFRISTHKKYETIQQQQKKTEKIKTRSHGFGARWPWAAKGFTLKSGARVLLPLLPFWVCHHSVWFHGVKCQRVAYRPVPQATLLQQQKKNGKITDTHRERER